MANPIYHADPEFYERPGETVHLEVDQHPSMFTVPALPWLKPTTTELKRGARAERLSWTNDPCAICTRPTTNPNGLCSYCTRAQERDETFKARANIPQPSRPRIAIREGWEVFAGEQSTMSETMDDSLESGHVRPYETRIG